MRGLLATLLGPTGTEHEEAWERAEELLASSLTTEQHEQYASKGYVEVPSRMHAGRTYRVDSWRPVAVHQDGRFVGAVCIRPREHLPGPDVLLARKLLIEGAEDEFLRAGNWLQPAWRPAGAAPTAFLLFALLSPWLIHLKSLGPWGVVTALVLVSLPGLIFVRRWVRRR